MTGGDNRWASKLVVFNSCGSFVATTHMYPIGPFCTWVQICTPLLTAADVVDAAVVLHNLAAVDSQFCTSGILLGSVVAVATITPNRHHSMLAQHLLALQLCAYLLWVVIVAKNNGNLGCVRLLHLRRLGCNIDFNISGTYHHA